MARKVLLPGEGSISHQHYVMWDGLIATYVTSCSSSVGDVANVLEGGVALPSFTSMVPPPQQCHA